MKIADVKYGNGFGSHHGASLDEIISWAKSELAPPTKAPDELLYVVTQLLRVSEELKAFGGEESRVYKDGRVWV